MIEKIFSLINEQKGYVVRHIGSELSIRKTSEIDWDVVRVVIPLGGENKGVLKLQSPDWNEAFVFETIEVAKEKFTELVMKLNMNDTLFYSVLRESEKWDIDIPEIETMVKKQRMTQIEQIEDHLTVLNHTIKKKTEEMDNLKKLIGE